MAAHSIASKLASSQRHLLPSPYILAVLAFELRALNLLGRSPTTWATPQVYTTLLYAKVSSGKTKLSRKIYTKEASSSSAKGSNWVGDKVSYFRKCVSSLSAEPGHLANKSLERGSVRGQEIAWENSSPQRLQGCREEVASALRPSEIMLTQVHHGLAPLSPPLGGTTVLSPLGKVCAQVHMRTHVSMCVHAHIHRPPPLPRGNRLQSLLCSYFFLRGKTMALCNSWEPSAVSSSLSAMPTSQNMMIIKCNNVCEALTHSGHSSKNGGSFFLAIIHEFFFLL
jgi:hypothetical protein